MRVTELCKANMQMYVCICYISFLIVILSDLNNNPVACNRPILLTVYKKKSEVHIPPGNVNSFLRL